MKKTLIFLLCGILAISAAAAQVNLGAQLAGEVESYDRQNQCFISEESNWECEVGAGFPDGMVRYSPGGINPTYTQHFEFRMPDSRGRYDEWYNHITHIQTKLIGIENKPGNNELADSAWATPTLWDGGCYIPYLDYLMVSSSQSIGLPCDFWGGIGFKVLGFEELITSDMEFTYDLGEELVPGFYYVYPTVNNNGAPADLQRGGELTEEYFGDGTWNFDILLFPDEEPIYFAVAPEFEPECQGSDFISCIPSVAQVNHAISEQREPSSLIKHKLPNRLSKEDVVRSLRTEY